jgi:hypothetical protein
MLSGSFVDRLLLRSVPKVGQEGWAKTGSLMNENLRDGPCRVSGKYGYIKYPVSG